MTLSLSGSSLYGFESTKVLPEGVRNLTVKSVHTTIGHKSNNQGGIDPIAEPLEKNLDFERVVKGEIGIKKKSLQSLMLHEGFSPEDTLGQFSADMQGRVSVTAPILSWGITDKLTLAIAAPWYQAKMGVKVGFNMNHENINKLKDSLKDKSQYQALTDVSSKLNDAVGELQEKLRDNGFREMRDWDGKGLGDMTIAGKYRAIDGDSFKLATINGIIAPTGRVSDPDILNDIPFGRGTWDVFSAVITDEYLGKDLFFNQYAKFTYPFKSSKEIRLATEDESIEVDKATVVYKLGPKWEAGASVQYEPQSGLVAGLGYVVAKKLGDTYEIENNPDSRSKLQKDTHEQSQHWEAKLGYSGIPAYQRGEIPAPFSATIEYKRHIASVNSFSNDFVTVDLALFF